MSAREVLSRKRDEVLARRLEVHHYEPAAIELGIREIAQSLVSPCVLAVESLVSRAIADPPSDYYGKPIKSTLREDALAALAPLVGNPLLTTCAIVIGSYSKGNYNRIKCLLYQLKIDLSPKATELWERIGEEDFRPSWQVVADATGLINWANHPRSDRIRLFDHCRRVHGDPNPITVVAIATAYTQSLNFRQYPQTFASIVRATLWGRDPAPLFEVMGRNINQYLHDVLDLLTSPLLPDSDKEQFNRATWQKVMDPSYESLLVLTDMLIDNLDKLSDAQKTEVAERIFAAESCPWLWSRWQELLRELPCRTATAQWFMNWDYTYHYWCNTTTRYQSPPFVAAMVQLGALPVEDVLQAVPAEVQVGLAEYYCYANESREWIFSNAGFVELVQQSPECFLPTLQPHILSGETSIGVVMAVLPTMSTKDGRELFLTWADAAKKHWHSFLFVTLERSEGGISSLIAEMNRLDVGVTGILRHNSNFHELLRNGYELRPEDMSAIHPDEFSRTDTDTGKIEFHPSPVWDNSHNATAVLQHQWERHHLHNIVRSVVVNCYSQKRKHPTEWLEEIVVPELLQSPQLMHEFCEAAWSDLRNAKFARIILMRDDRIHTWMSKDELDQMMKYIHSRASHFISHEQTVLRAILSPTELIDIFFEGVKRHGCCDITPWLDIFEDELAKRRLVEFVDNHLHGRVSDDALRWVGDAQLAHYPSIRHKLEKLLDTEGNTNLVAQVAELLST